MRIVLMGPSGCGKSAVGAALAARLGWPLIEGDDYHSAANVAKMARGAALSDGDRWPWLDRLGRALGEHERCVATCSALRRAYRDRLRAAAGAVRLVYLRVDRETLAARLERRRGHFFDPALLDSQLATLEEPEPGEALVVEADALGPDALAGRVVSALEMEG